MADTKEIRVVADIQDKMGATRAGSVIRQVKDAMNPRHIKETSKLLETMKKTVFSMSGDWAKIGKTIEKQMLGGIKDSTKAMKDYAVQVTKVEKAHTKINSAGFTKSYIERNARLMASQLPGGGPGTWGTMSAPDQQELRQKAEMRLQALQAKIGGQNAELQAGAGDIASQYIQTQADLKAQRNQQIAMGLYTAAQGVRVGGSALATLFSFDQSKLANEAAKLSFGRDLYSQLASGDIEGVRAIRATQISKQYASKDTIMRRGLASGPITSEAAHIAENAEKAAFTQKVTGVVSGILATAAAARAGTSTGGASNTILQNFAQGARATVAGGGLESIIAGGAALMAGVPMAAQGAAAAAAIQAQTTKDDPRFQQSLSWFHANRNRIAYREMTGRGGMDVEAELGASGMLSGLDSTQSLATYDSMAKRMGYGDRTKEFAKHALTSQGRYGVDAGVAGEFLGATGTRNSAKMTELEEVIGRGFAKGFKDPNVKNAMVEFATSAAFNAQSGRGGGAGLMPNIVALGAGTGSSPFEQQQAISGAGILDQVLKNPTGANAALGINTARKILGSKGNAIEALALSQMGLTDYAAVMNKDGKVPDYLLAAFGGNEERARKAGVEGYKVWQNNLLMQVPEMRKARAAGREWSDIAGDKEIMERTSAFISQGGVFGNKIDISKAKPLTAILTKLAGGEKISDSDAAAIDAAKKAGGTDAGPATTAAIAVLQAQLQAVTDASGKFAEQLKSIYTGYERVLAVAEKDNSPADILADVATQLERIRAGYVQIIPGWTVPSIPLAPRPAPSQEPKVR